MSGGKGDNKRTVEGVKEFLETLPEVEIHALVKTTTGSISRFSNKIDAIEELLKYSDSVSILNRKRVKKEYLIKYLIKKDVPFSMNCDKSKLCRHVLEHWDYGKPDELKDLRFLEAPEVRKKPNPLRDYLAKAPQPSTSAAAGLPKDDDKKEPKCRVEEVAPLKSQLEVPMPPFIPAPLLPEARKQTAEMGTNTVCTDLSTLECNDIEAMDYEECVSLRKLEREMGQKLAQEFVTWFYQRLNSQQDFIAHHFWTECNLRMELAGQRNSDDLHVAEFLHNGLQCYEQMRSLRNEREFIFNANLSPGIGVRGKINPHGLAQVFSCGTIHMPLSNGRDGFTEAVGVFEQVFGLSKDPSAGNNYRIKFSILRLRLGNYIENANQPPALCDSSIVGILEEESSGEEELD